MKLDTAAPPGAIMKGTALCNLKAESTALRAKGRMTFIIRQL